jgi:Replication-relaxation
MVTAVKKFDIDFQERDLAIVRGLFDSRIATIHHLSALHFEGRLEAARKRVKKLKRAGIIHERPRRATEPSIHCLTRKAFEMLEKHGVLAEYPPISWSQLEKRARVSPLTLKHELEVMDCKAAITTAAVREGFAVTEFCTWPKLFEFVARDSVGKQTLVKPDGFLRLQGNDKNGRFEDAFFLEVDRSSEDQGRLAERAACYRDYYFRGGLASRFGRPRSEYKQFPFVVLMVFKNSERRNNTAERLLQIVPSIHNQVWLSTLKEATTDPLGAIWVKPTDYARLTTGTEFDVERRRSFQGYRRQPEREEFVEKNIVKHPLLTPSAEAAG